MPVAWNTSLQGKTMPDKLRDSQSLPLIRWAEQFRLPLPPVLLCHSTASASHSMPQTVTTLRAQWNSLTFPPPQLCSTHSLTPMLCYSFQANIVVTAKSFLKGNIKLKQPVKHWRILELEVSNRQPSMTRFLQMSNSVTFPRFLEKWSSISDTDGISKCRESVGCGLAGSSASTTLCHACAHTPCRRRKYARCTSAAARWNTRTPVGTPHLHSIIHSL